jgi:glucose/arabinose dehydrogenase
MRILILGLVCFTCSTIDAAAQLTTRVHASGFSRPVAFVQDPTTPDVQFVVEQGGTIRVIQNGTVLSTPFLSVAVSSTGERGLLGLAFPPNAAATGRFFVNFTNPAGDTVIARFRRSGNPLVGDPASRFDLQWIGGLDPGRRFIAQPFSNHNGGHLSFGPDGYLYIGLGDGGSGNDPLNHAQRRDSLLGKMLRIDVNVDDSDPEGYNIPPSNPFVGGGAPPEVWSFGWRNPWRYSFDNGPGGTGALIAGDVGQGRREEINFEPAGRGGRNYGWRNFEGTLPNVGDTAPAYQPLTNPIYEYDRSFGASITGGVVYRGAGLGVQYPGRYFYADFVSSRVYSIRPIVGADGEGIASDFHEHTSELGGVASLGGVSAFGVDANREMYIVSYGRGVILKVVGVPSAPTNLRIIR